MKWPKKIYLCNDPWVTKLVAQKTIPGLDGWLDEENQAIVIPRVLKGRVRWQSLLHELMHHAWRSEVGWDMPYDSLEERLIRTMEPTLYKTLHDNFDFGD